MKQGWLNETRTPTGTCLSVTLFQGHLAWTFWVLLQSLMRESSCFTVSLLLYGVYGFSDVVLKCHIQNMK